MDYIRSQYTMLHVRLMMLQKRTAENLTQEQAAKRLAMPPTTYWKYEQGEIEPTGSRLLKILTWVDLLKPKE